MEQTANLVLKSENTVRDALAKLVKNGRQIILVVDENGRLIGTVTDGDIRRGLLRDVSLDSELSAIVNRKPTTVLAGTSRESCFRTMRDRGLRHLPIVGDDGVLVGVELLSTILQEVRYTNTVVLFAGGRGDRLMPLTKNTPKPMLPVGGRPLLEIIIDSFARQGFENFIISVNYLSNVIEEYFGDGARFGVSITYLRETSALGTAGSLSLLTELPSEPIIVMNSDIVTGVDFRSILAFHDELGADATICVRKYDFQIPFGVVEADRTKLVRISEKPLQRLLVNGGIYVLNPSILSMLEYHCRIDMPELLERASSQGKEIGVFPIQEYWMDVGRISDLEQASSDILTPGLVNE